MKVCTDITMLHEISRRYIHLSKHEEPHLCWYNTVLCVQANKHLTFFDFSYNLESLENKIDLKENAVKYPSDSPVSTEFLQSYVQKRRKNVELMEMITNPSFWPHSNLLKMEMDNIKCLKCSPDNFIYHCQNIIAVVNNFGNVNFLAPNRGAYSSHLDFSTVIKENMKFADYLNEAPDNIDKLKEIVYKFSTSAICWSPEMNVDNSCYFVTIQNSGNILFWSIKTELWNITSEFCGSIDTNGTAPIEEVVWIPIKNNKILLICSNILGQVIKYECILDNKHFKLVKENYIWEHKDKMVANVLHYHTCKEKIFIIYNKNRHVVIQILDEKLDLLTQKIVPVNDQKVMSIVNFNGVFYLGTLNTKLYKLNISFVNDLNVSLDSIEIKENFQAYELYGIGISQNNAIIALALKDRKLLHRKESLKIDIVFFASNNDPLTELNSIIKNPSQSFARIWDSIELLRCKVIRNKNIPDFDFDSLLLESKTNVYPLKVYFFILILYINLKKSKPVSLKSLPNTNFEEIQEKILVFQAIRLLNNIHKKYEKKNFDKLQSEFFMGAKNFLTYYCDKYKKSISELIEIQVLNICNSTVEYFCQSCDSKLKGFSCSNEIEHFNMFCSLTFTPIETNNYLICKACGVTAREELYDEKPKCLFCDMNFVHYDTII